MTKIIIPAQILLKGIENVNFCLKLPKLSCVFPFFASKILKVGKSEIFVKKGIMSLSIFILRK